MNIIEEDIRKGQFKRIYLICGEEAYLKDYYAKELEKALFPEEDPINFTRCSQKEAEVSALISQAETLPFFSDYRLISVKDSGLFKKGGDALAQYSKSIPASTVFLFREEEVDKRSRLFKAVREQGGVLECTHLNTEKLTNWIVRRLAREHKQILRSALTLLLERAGEDMVTLSNEMDKLIAYVGEREGITKEDVEQICPERLEDRVYRMVDAAASGDRKKAFSIYRDLVFRREPPLRILAAVTAHFRRLWLVRDLRDQGYDRQSIESRTGYKYYMVRALIGQSEHYDVPSIRRILSECAKADEYIKTGKMNDRIAIELVLEQICAQ